MVTVLDRIDNQPRLRHPEKAHRPDQEVARKPDWIRVRAPNSKGYAETREIVKSHGLVTVCEEAGCPNIGECWDKKHATFMIMGEICTRACAFCNVSTGRPNPLDPNEPDKVADAVHQMGLTHVVITSVDRDDLADGGAEHFAQVIRAIRRATPLTTIEILTPDFLRKEGALEVVVAAKPDVFNHNLETVPSNYLTVRPGARYFHSIRLLQRVKELDPTIFTKSGIMVGLGEERNEILQLMDDLRSAEVDFMTIGQYLQPSKKHHPVIKFVTPDEFKSFETVGMSKGFLLVASSPLTRSSHHAGDDFAKLRSARLAHLQGARVNARSMPKFDTSRQVRHSPEEMFRLVADVEKYPEFLPLCEALSVRSRRERDGQTLLVADMTVGYKALRETFTSQVHLKPDENTIDVKYVDGPFRYLTNIWRFEEDGQGGALVLFSIDYEFKSRLLGMLMGSMFDRAFRTFAEAFEKRADAIYGKAG